MRCLHPVAAASVAFAVATTSARADDVAAVKANDPTKVVELPASTKDATLLPAIPLQPPGAAPQPPGAP